MITDRQIFEAIKIFERRTEYALPTVTAALRDAANSHTFNPDRLMQDIITLNTVVGNADPIWRTRPQTPTKETP